MATLLLRLAGPLQAWGTDSLFPARRDTGLEPSKSGVIGLLAAALGRYREDSIDDLAALQFGVRVDQEGVPYVDYQTTHNILTAGGDIKPTDVSRRTYLADAVFLAGLAGDRALLQQCYAALRHPARLLALGRRCCVPGAALWLPQALTERDLLEALQAYPWLGAQRWRRPDQVRVVMDDPAGSIPRADQPYGAAFAARTFTARQVRVVWVPAPRYVAEEVLYGNPDPFAVESAAA